MSAPTSFALAVLSPAADLMVASMVDADAKVWPTLSSTICTNMCRADRFTTSRGRAAVPVTFLRTRRCRRTRARVLSVVRDPTRPVAYSRDDLLALVSYALALVRVGLAELADPRRGLAHQLLVDALDHEPGRRLHAQGDPLRW